MVSDFIVLINSLQQFMLLSIGIAFMAVIGAPKSAPYCIRYIRVSFSYTIATSKYLILKNVQLGFFNKKNL